MFEYVCHSQPVPYMVSALANWKRCKQKIEADSTVRKRTKCARDRDGMWRQIHLSLSKYKEAHVEFVVEILLAEMLSSFQQVAFTDKWKKGVGHIIWHCATHTHTNFNHNCTCTRRHVYYVHRNVHGSVHKWWWCRPSLISSMAL